MNTEIELHDSTLAAVGFSRAEAVLSLRPAYIHRSSGRPGIDHGTGWVQDATITIFNASATELPVRLPADVSEGGLCVADKLYQNILPVLDSTGEAVVVELLLVTAEKLSIRGNGIRIRFSGAAKYVEDFRP
ncbi:MAG: hypothetical protein WC740_20490 [Verrucomicrobiia bacterium]